MLTVIAFPTMIVALVWLFKPPDFMKPSWLREVESGAIPEPQTPVFGAPSPGGARRLDLPPVVYWGLWAATGVISCCGSCSIGL